MKTLAPSWLLGALIVSLSTFAAQAEDDVIQLRCETQAKVQNKKTRKVTLAPGFFNGVILVVDRRRETMLVGSLVRIPLGVQSSSYKINYSAKEGVLHLVINRKTGALKVHQEGPKFIREEQGRCRRYDPTS